MSNDPGLRRLEMQMCARDVVHWCNQWAMTYDPRANPSLIPLDLFPKQEEFLRWLGERERLQQDGLVEKSRDVGASWLCCAYALHGWLFREGYQAGFGSRKLEYVDNRGDPKSIFEKLRLLFLHLPLWMRPPGFNPVRHSGEAKLINPANGSTITGEGGDNIGRGARSSLYVIDEAAYLERPLLADRALSQTTCCRIDVSTPNGPGTPFASKRFGGGVPVFVLDWHDDPRKNFYRVLGTDGAEVAAGSGVPARESVPFGCRVVWPWYEEQKRKFDVVTVAQEIDRDHSASVEGIAIPAAWVRAAVGLPLPPSAAPVVAGLDVAEEGRDLTVLAARKGPLVLPPVSWARLNTTQTAWRARDEAQRSGASVVNYDAGGVGAGIRGTWDSFEGQLPFRVVAVNAGSTPTDAVWPDGRGSREKFLNLRAELWWRLRLRFERSYEHREGIAVHASEDMISLPDCPQLVAELSQPLYRYTDTGKLKIEGKKEMASRGVKSGDYADALCLAFMDEPYWEAPSTGAAAPRPEGGPRWQPGQQVGPNRGSRLFGGR